MKELNILMIEDSAADAMLVESVLRTSGLAFRLTRVDTQPEFDQQLDDHPPDLVLSDHGLPGFDSLGALAKTRLQLPHVPFIFVTGSRFVPPVENPSLVADDYILKTDLRALTPAIQRALSSLNDFGPLPPEKKPAPESLVAELESANKELEHFCNSIALELRSPLRNVDALAGMLSKTARAKLDEKSRSYLQGISDSMQKATKLVDELLAFSRINHTQLCKLPFSSADVVKEAIHDLRNETQGRTIEWIIGHLPEVHGDPVMLWLVWVNLISNALKFTRAKHDTRIEIGCDTSGPELQFFIRDNGIGFDIDRAENLFQIFQRLHPANDFEGIGVGLANVRRIIQRHGGRVWASGKTNEGATFYFTLPKLPSSSTPQCESISEPQPPEKGN